MASGMKDLVVGDCGGANPLMKLTSHVMRDQSFRQEGIGGSHIDARPGIPLTRATEEELVNEFLAEQRGSLHSRAPTTFSMEKLMREMHGMEGATGPMHQARPMMSERENARDGGDWIEQYLGDVGPVNVDQADWSKEYLETPPVHLGHGDARWTTGLSEAVNDTSTKWAADYLEQNEHADWAHDLDIRSDDKNWLETYSKMLPSDDTTTELDRVEDKLAESEAQGATSGKTVTDEWIDDFDSMVDSEFWNNMQRQWDQGLTATGEDEFHPWISDFDSYQRTYPEYNFEKENALLDHPNPFAEGLERLKKGDIPNAVLLFEAAVQKEPDRAEVWQYLGTTQADNEQEPLAIAALNKCLELEPGNLTALLSLAVSYTNEMQQQAACDTLLRWLRSNQRYAHLVGGEAAGSEASPGTTFTQVKDLFLQAVLVSKKDIDADVQTCLGVLFNISGEYDKAVDCFSAALQVKPEDWLLWNKLGATLANGKRSEESVEAYHNALRLSPGYIRTRYNLGIACINLQAHREAVEHFLTALNLQKRSHEGSSASGGTASSKSPASVMSSNIWSTLRMCLSMLSRNDLHTACDTQDLDILNREFNVDPQS